MAAKNKHGGIPQILENIVPIKEKEKQEKLFRKEKKGKSKRSTPSGKQRRTIV